MVGLLFAVATEPLAAAINPNFTPVDVVSESTRILHIASQSADGNALSFRILTCLKGKASKKSLLINTGSCEKYCADHLRGIVRAVGKGPAIFFVGEYSQTSDMDEDESMEEPAEETASLGYLHIGSVWFQVDGSESEGWNLRAADKSMQATWAGGTDMLLRAVGYILTDPNPSIPTESFTAWSDPLKFGNIDGSGGVLTAVDLDGAGRLSLFAASEKGDRLWAWDAKKKTLADRTKDRGLSSKSLHAAWADCNGDGRLDLVGWDGSSVRLRTQAEDGSFSKSVTIDVGAPLRDVLGITPIDAGGGTGLLISTPVLPVLIVPADGKWKSIRLSPPPGDTAADLGRSGRCLVADLDGDGYTDVLQPFERGGRLFKGKGVCEFDAGSALPVGLGPGRGSASVGDFDMDGLLDIFTAADDRCRIWQNHGNGAFTESLQFSGEIAYISKPRGFAGQVCDINNDGRQDVLILYRNRGPQIFFSRGFRSFGHGHGLDIQDLDLLPAATDGQRAGVIADLDGNGSQDMALLLQNGELWFFANDLEAESSLGVRVSLAVGAGIPAGPLTVTARNDDDRCLGAWNVTAGGPGAFFGAFEPGTLSIHWQIPGAAKAMEKEVSFDEKRMIRFVLPLK